MLCALPLRRHASGHTRWSKVCLVSPVEFDGLLLAPLQQGLHLLPALKLADVLLLVQEHALNKALQLSHVCLAERLLVAMPLDCVCIQNFDV